MISESDFLFLVIPLAGAKLLAFWEAKDAFELTDIKLKVKLLNKED